jgi:hypothetical protein
LVLALVATGGARLNAGSVGLAIARIWSEADRRVLFIDGDTEGTALADRLGSATRSGYSPAERGLPSLIAARRPVTLKLLADHCVSLGTSVGSLWGLFAPYHPAGAAYAAGWLSERVPEIQALAHERTVLVATGLHRADSPLLPLLRAARIVVFLAPAHTPQQLTALGELREASGLARPGRQVGVLVSEDTPTIPDEVIRTASGLPLAGRLPLIEDEGVLRGLGGRRERLFARAVRELGDGLLKLLGEVEGAGDLPLRPDLTLVSARRVATADADSGANVGDGSAAAADGAGSADGAAGGAAADLAGGGPHPRDSRLVAGGEAS